MYKLYVNNSKSIYISRLSVANIEHINPPYVFPFTSGASRQLMGSNYTKFMKITS